MLSVQPPSLSFQAVQGSGNPQPQTLLINNSGGSSLGWGATSSTTAGGNWLTASPATGSTPTIAAVSVNASNLSPGTYRGTVTVQAPLASPSTQAVSVEVTVQAASPAKLTVEPSALNFETPAGSGNPPPQGLRISNAGSGTLNWTVQSTTVNGGNWLVLAPSSGTASATSPGVVQVIANTAGLSAGFYSGSVRLESSTTGDKTTVAVNLVLSQVGQTILVSQSGLLFTGVEGAGLVPSQNFGILNTGQGAMNWTVEAVTLSGGNWLSVSPASGASTANSLEIPLVDVAVNVTGLRAGQYSGFVRVSAAAANNSPQVVSVDLTVLPAGSNPGVLVRPTGLIFAAEAGGPSPTARSVRMGTAARGTVDARGILGAFDGGSWLEAVPRNATIGATDPKNVLIQTTLGSLSAGIYRGALTFLFGDGSPTQVVNILFLVVPRGSVVSGFEPMALENAQGCLPQRLLTVDRGLAATGSFSALLSWPTTIEAEVKDNCGSVVPGSSNPVPATVVASFSNGDPALPLVHIGAGVYHASWRPANPQAQVTVNVRASLPPLAPGEIQLQGRVLDNPAGPPAVFPGGVVNNATFTSGAAVAPGSIVSAFGRNLASGNNQASRLPLDTTLGGISMTVGGRDAPLFFTGAGQINAHLPSDLPANSRVPVVVKARRGTGAEFGTVPETITIAAIQPGIFTMSQDGKGQGAILNSQGRLVNTAAPAAVGEVVQVFATGLGATQPPVPAGQQAPAAPNLATVVTPVKARVGGRDARVLFAGLAPGFAGLYQVNVEIPSGVPPGSAVELVLLQNDVPSNAVTLAIR